MVCEWTDLDATRLTIVDLRSKMGASVGRRVTVAGEVELRRLAVSKFHKKGDVDVNIPAGCTRGREITFVAVLAPIDGYASGCTGGFGNKATYEEEKVYNRFEKNYVSHIFCLLLGCVVGYWFTSFYKRLCSLKEKVIFVCSFFNVIIFFF